MKSTCAFQSKQQNRIWNSKTEFETAEQNLELLRKILFRYPIFCVAVWDFVVQLQILLCLISQRECNKSQAIF